MSARPDEAPNSPVRIALSPDRSRAAVRLFHPKGNIITEEMIRALSAALEGAGRNPDLKLITIEGAGGDFSFGASIPEHAPGEIGRVLPLAHALIESLLDVPAVTAAVVRGRCLGGGFEIALACDFIFAESSAVFGLPEIALGVFPPAASALLPARVGAARAAGPILTGAPASAVEWERAGLVSLVTADGRLQDEVDRWFDRHLAGRSASALRYAAAAARALVAQQVRAVLPELERLYLADLMKTADAIEGVAAFSEKRPPTWKNR